MSEENKIRPFLIGIVDGSLSNQLAQELDKRLEGYPICKLSMSNYLKDGAKNEAIKFQYMISKTGKELMKLKK